MLYQWHNYALLVADSEEELAAWGKYAGILPQRFAVVITDPPWPNTPEGMFDNSERTFECVQAVSRHFPEISDRAVIIMGTDSDPRFLQALPPEMPFFRTLNLEYVKPNYNGRILNTGLAGYVYGTPPAWIKGKGVLPGRVMSRDFEKRIDWHPCPRRTSHLKWLINWYGWDGPILDPFAGSGTLLVSAYDMAHPHFVVAIEKNPEYGRRAWLRFMEHVRTHPNMFLTSESWKKDPFTPVTL